MLIDTHCHLNFHAFTDVGEVIQRAKAIGVEKIIVPGAKLDSSKKAVEIAQQFKECFAAVGVHPHHFSELEKISEPEICNSLRLLAKNKKVVAIGEIGLDYYDYPQTSYEKYAIDEKVKAQQKELLLIQLDLANQLNLPVILHCREAFSDLLSLIKTILNTKKIQGVFHCFGGTLENLREVLSLGFYIGFDGNITYKSAQNLRDLVKETPLKKILLETDSPFLAPIPYRGERNEPKNVKIIAETISQIKKTDTETVEKVTSDSANNLFRLKYV